MHRLALLEHALNGIEPHTEVFNLGAIAEAHEVVAGAFEQVPPGGGVDIEGYAGYADCLLLEEFFEEDQTVIQRSGQTREVDPDVERRFGRVCLETQLVEALEDIVAFLPKVLLDRELV
jgi:hypothetical protein